MPVPRWLAAYLLASIAAGALGGAAVLRYGAQRPYAIIDPAPSALDRLLGNSTTTLSLLRQDELQTIDVVRRASPAVVSIVITKELTERTPDDFFSDLFNDRFFSLPRATSTRVPTTTSDTPPQRLRVGGGSGFLVTDDGYIITNRHVVDDKKAEYSVLLQDGREFAGRVLALDPSLDLAVLKIEGRDFPFVTLGDSDQIQIGQTVIAIGNALAEFQNTVTKGIISGVNRRLVAGSGLRTEIIEGALQTDAAINPGNSGGPLLDLEGNVIGMNTAISEDAQSLGFALPINVAKQAVESVKRTGKIVRPWIGVRYVRVDKDLAKEKGLAQSYGVFIERGRTANEPAIIPGSPAEKAGLKERDVILAINGQKLDEMHSLSAQVTRFAPGDEVELTLLRNGKEQKLRLKLEERQ
ncbi:trypsin-like peptidase domain-containing protein [Patescibacteria group bacterium]|nr:trypsin-like peptidase domain-containing protein [Patescibacteria group bacterium]